MKYGCKVVKVLSIDNRDTSTSEIIMDNETVVEVDVLDLFENMLENASEEDRSNILELLVRKYTYINLF
jgi:hypothetical protein